MLISAMVAMSENRVIGKNNQLPWHLPADLQHFKAVTMGKPILMGRKTFDSIGRPLPGRKNIVITRNAALELPGCEVVMSIEQGLALVEDQEEVVVIGGSQLFEQALPLVQRLYLTVIHEEFEGDAFFPVLDESEWKEIQREDHAPDEKNKYRYSFLMLEKLDVLDR